ncbi:hypothetical protein GALMADRAFT_640332 [Galerina marginata CBS 339.88]|uniref:Cyclin N-terminal domain-containing protein n=1 Tax=Galerina marginata (strain CBS 339.88) TaxID=685588 RepID=A0A067TU20_GALM3|nr:hypothetical protein GALMADRAFT_640332 [Galerina marginata CBS 339.88]
MPLFAVYSLILRLASGNRLATVHQNNAFAYPSLSRLNPSINPNLIRFRSNSKNTTSDLPYVDNCEDDNSFTFEKGILHVFNEDEEEKSDWESVIDQAESPSLFERSPPVGMIHALNIQYSPRVPFTSRYKEPIPQVFQLGPHIIATVESHDAFNSPHNSSVTSEGIRNQDVFDFPPHTSGISEGFVASDEQIEILVLHHQAGRADTLSLRQWFANFLLCHLLRRDEGNPVPYSSANEITVAHLADNMFEFFWFGYRANDELAFLATQYISDLLPRGLMDAKDLYTPCGVVAATRLFVLTYTLAIKNVEDQAYRLNKWTSYYGTKFEPPSATQFEIAALQALDFNITLQPDQWRAHLRHLYDWTGQPRTDFRDAHLNIHTRIGAVYSAAVYPATTKRERPRPSSPGFSLDRLYDRLLDDLGCEGPSFGAFY